MGVTIVCVIEKQEVMVRALVEGGLLHAAGLKVGDRILEINNTAPKSAANAAEMLNADVVELLIERKTQPDIEFAPSFVVTLYKAEPEEALGLVLHPNRVQATNRSNLREGGLVYSSGRVVQGLDVGDLVLCVAARPVETPADAERLYAQAPVGQVKLVVVKSAQGGRVGGADRP